MGSMFNVGDKVEVMKSSLNSYGCVGTVSGFYDNKIKVKFNSYVMNKLGLGYPTLTFSPTSITLLEKEDEWVHPTTSQEKLLARIDQHQLHCNEHPNDVDAQEYLKGLKSQLGNESLKDIKKSLEPEHKIFCALFRTSKRFSGYQYVGSDTAKTKEEAQEKLENILLNLESKRIPGDDDQYHVIIRKLPTPVKLECKMIKLED